MHFVGTFLVIVAAFCTMSYAVKINGNYFEVHEIGNDTLATPEQLPPQDPAIHSFPTVPTVPLIPTCTNDGYFRDPFNCRKFYYCEYENAVPAGFYCQDELIFDTITNHCDDPENVEC